jgi:hypothetical protein
MDLAPDVLADVTRNGIELKGPADLPLQQLTSFFVGSNWLKLAHELRKRSDVMTNVVVSLTNILFYCDILGHLQSAASWERGLGQ